VTGTAQGSAKAQAYQQEIADSVYEYFDKILDEREKEPRDDLLSHFLSAEVEGNRLSRNDILDICFLFLIAGLDTVTATLDCMFSFLAEHPEHRRQLVENPDVIPNAIEELLRWETPVMMVSRVAVQDTELGGCPVHKGDHAIVVIGSANVDEAEFPDADQVRFDREVNRHIAFGGGVHRCLGSHLARLELRVALRSGTSASPTTRSSPAKSSSTRRASAPSTSSRCASRRRGRGVGTTPPAVGHMPGPAALVPVTLFVPAGRVGVPA